MNFLRKNTKNNVSIYDDHVLVKPVGMLFAFSIRLNKGDFFKDDVNMYKLVRFSDNKAYIQMVKPDNTLDIEIECFPNWFENRNITKVRGGDIPVIVEKTNNYDQLNSIGNVPIISTGNNITRMIPQNTQVQNPDDYAQNFNIKGRSIGGVSRTKRRKNRRNRSRKNRRNKSRKK